MALYPRRYTTVPWLSDDGDLQPQGEVATSVELRGGEEVAVGLWIREPFGKGSDTMLTIHALKGDGTDGGTITLAITHEIALQVQPVVERNLQSNPRRQADGDPGDD